MYRNSNQSYRDRVAGNLNNFNSKKDFKIHNPNNDNSQNRRNHIHIFIIYLLIFEYRSTIAWAGKIVFCLRTSGNYD
jgi:hypothetical protein